MKNTSPVPIADIAGKKGPIAARLHVSAVDPESPARKIVSAKLEDARVFEEVTLSDLGADLELVVSATSAEDTHFGESMLEAVIIGLTMMTTNGLFTDTYDYNVTLKARLLRGSEEVAQYLATGSYQALVPTRYNLASAMAVQVEARLKSWQHATSLLADQLARDRAKIISASGNSTLVSSR